MSVTKRKSSSSTNLSSMTNAILAGLVFGSLLGLLPLSYEQPAPEIPPKPKIISVSQFKENYWDWIKGAECGPIKNCCVTLKDDPAGFTCFGVTVKYNPSFHKIAKMLDTASNQKILELMALDTFYTEKFIHTSIYKLHPNWHIYVLDYAIHSGSRKAIKDLQRIIGTKADGFIGKKTIKKSFTYHSEKTILKYIKKRRKFIGGLSNYKTHKCGWNYRLDKLSCTLNKEKPLWGCKDGRKFPVCKKTTTKQSG